MSFDNKAATWDDNPMKVERSKILAQKIINFTEGKNLSEALEFGCGTGLLSFFLKDNFSKITLADTSSGMIDVLKEKIESAKVTHLKPVLLDEDGNFESENYDIVYSLLTLHHIENLNQAFNQFSHMVNAGGYLCIADLVKEDGDFHTKEDSEHLHHGFEKKHLVQELNKHGFTYDDYQIFYTIEKNVDSGELKKFPLFLLIVKKNAIE